MAEEMSSNRKSSTSNYQRTEEPKVWTEDLHGQTDREDEFMLVIEDQEPELAVLKSRSASKDRAKKCSNGDLRPGSTGYHHLDEFERKLEEMRRELENDVGLDDSLDREVEENSAGKDEFDLIKDELTGSTLRRMKNVESPPPPPAAVRKIPEDEEGLASVPEAPPRRRSRSRDTTPSRFLSAMTGGFVESKRFGSIVSLVRNRSRSRSRFSERSGDLPEGVSLLPEIGAGAEVVVEKLRKITGRKRNVKQVDFDELFARGLAMGEEHEEKKVAEMTVDAPMIKFEEDTGINMKDCEMERGRDRGRKRRKIPPTPADQILPASEPAKADYKTRTRSREYARPEEIRLSPVPKRDLLTGKPLGGCSQEELFLHKVTNFIAQNQLQLQAKQDESLIKQLEAKQKESECDLLNPASAITGGYKNQSTSLKKSPPRTSRKTGETGGETSAVSREIISGEPGRTGDFHSGKESFHFFNFYRQKYFQFSVLFMTFFIHREMVGSEENYLNPFLRALKTISRVKWRNTRSRQTGKSPKYCGLRVSRQTRSSTRT